MMTFKLGAWKTGGRPGVALPAKSSQTTITKLNVALLAPGTESQPAKTLEIPKPARPREKIERFYPDGSRTRRLRLWVSSLPLSIILALGLYLYLTGKPEWIPGSLMLGGFVVFGLAGLLVECQRLKAFVCPGCEAPIKDWDTNETHRILFNCARCQSSWDIEYKECPSPADLPRRLQRAYLSALFSSGGTH